MNVADLMTRETRSLPPTATLREALSLMAEHHFRHLPVVESGRLVGVVSDRELLAATGGIDTPRADAKLAVVMHAKPTTASPADTLVTASVEMGLARIGCLPVVDDSGVLVGMLTETDLLRAFVKASVGGKLSGDADPTVDAVMTRDPRWVDPDTPLGEAMEAAGKQEFRHLPVLDPEGKILGILSERDLCRAIGRGTSPTTRVTDAMTRRVLTATPNETLSEAAESMLDHKISCLPVLRGETLIGILSTADLVDHCMNTLGEG